MRKLTTLFLASFSVVVTAFANFQQNASQFFEAASKEYENNNFALSASLFIKADSAYLAEGRENTLEYALSLHSTGKALLNTDNLQLGREYTKKALDLQEKLFGKSNNGYLASLNNYSISFLMANELEEALKYQKTVIEICSQMDPPNPDEGMYLINLGRIYYAMNDVDKAVEYMESALPKVEKFGEDYLFALDFLGNVYLERNDNANIIRILELIDENNRNELKKDCQSPECHLERAQFYFDTGDHSMAKEEFMAVFAMSLSDDQKKAAYIQYAKFLNFERDFAQAAEYYSMASEISSLIDDDKEKPVYFITQAGINYFQGGKYDKAVETLNKAIQEIDINGYSENLKSSALETLGNAYCGKKDFSQAIIEFKRLVAHMENNGHQEEAAYAKSLESLATAEKFNSEYDASIEDYKKAIDLYKKLGLYDRAEQAHASLNLCYAYSNKDFVENNETDLSIKQRNEKLQEVLSSSLNSLEQGGYYLGLLSKAQTLATIAGCYNLLEQFDNAIDYYSQYLEVLRPAIAEDFLLKTPKERELTWTHTLRNITDMNAMIMALPENSTDLYSRLSNLIYNGQLLAKGILLSSNIEFEKVLKKYGTQAMNSRYKDIKANLSEIEKMRQELCPISKIQELSRKTDSMQLDLAHEIASLNLFTDFINYTDKDVVKALKPDEAAIEFVTLDSGFLPSQNLIAGVLISKEFPTGITIPIGSVQQINSIIQDEKKFSTDAYTAFIWGNLLQAAQGKNKIYFSPDGIIHNIGIEYLSLEGKPLSELIELSRVSSTREICREHPALSLKYAALFGDIDYMEKGKPASRKTRTAKSADGISFSDLENTKREISKIKTLLEKNTKSKIFTYSSDKASKAEFLSQDQLPINLLHIATHGAYIDSDEDMENDAMERSILAFAGANLFDSYQNNSGIVTANEISEMSLHDCGLVVLSACETGKGQLGEDGVFGLQRGFKNAGVNTLLVSLNKVADAATADMMIAFYRNLLTPGSSKLEALKKAQSEVRLKYPDDDTWASFILIDSFN